ncbi:hypothetical protein MTR_6g078520 [Medicago truncatula]|uniref:Uncharacterized protein n=1 Tax=Medicago truncatula TaxID=3880 RepID=G7KKT0_MEDTR|nr:hypothetical protein MTR_6g078520 [Medicago truncatula]
MVCTQYLSSVLNFKVCNGSLLQNKKSYFVSSSFCLDVVLASIVDNFQENNNPKPYRLILPVYVDISPSDVQNQTVPYSEDNNKLIKWRNALSRVANLPAWNFKHGYPSSAAKLAKILRRG